MGKTRQAAEALEALAGRSDASEELIRSWLYRASQIYFTGHYYENAEAALSRLESMGPGVYEGRVKRDRAALAALRG